MTELEITEAVIHLASQRVPRKMAPYAAIGILSSLLADAMQHLPAIDRRRIMLRLQARTAAH